MPHTRAGGRIYTLYPFPWHKALYKVTCHLLITSRCSTEWQCTRRDRILDSNPFLRRITRSSYAMVLGSCTYMIFYAAWVAFNLWGIYMPYNQTKWLVPIQLGIYDWPQSLCMSVPWYISAGSRVCSKHACMDMQILSDKVIPSNSCWRGKKCPCTLLPPLCQPHSCILDSLAHCDGQTWLLKLGQVATSL